MATYKQYQCKHCGYTVEAPSNGHGLIMAGEVYTYTCKDCREIVSVLTFPNGEKAETIKCPECGSENLELWNPIKGKCPKCGGKFEETDMVIMVD